MAVGPFALMTCCATENCTCRFRQIHRTRAIARAPHRTSALRGVNDPNRQVPGAALLTQHRGRSRPADCARTSSDGTRRRRISTTSTRTTYCRSVPWPTTLVRSPRTVASPTHMAVRVLGDKFTSGTCPPAWRDSHRNQGRRLRLYRPLGTASTAKADDPRITPTTERSQVRRGCWRSQC